MTFLSFLSNYYILTGVSVITGILIGFALSLSLIRNIKKHKKQLEHDVKHSEDENALFQNEILTVKNELSELRVVKDAACLERNRLVAALASIVPGSGIVREYRLSDDREWFNVVYIDLPAGQVSWHFSGDQMWLFGHLPQYTKPFDFHTTEEKYNRLMQFMTNHDPAYS